MKHLLLLFLSTITVTFNASAQAQPGDQHAQTVRSLLQKQTQLPGNQKTTATHYRLVATNRTQNGVWQDSTYYYYSGGRGSTYVTEADDRSVTYSDWQFSPYTDPALQDIQCDSSRRYYLATSAIKRRYSYNSSNMVVQLEEYQSNTRYEYFYNANGDRDSVIRYSMTTGARLSKRSYTYDNQLRLTEEYEVSPDQQPVSKSTYSYYTSGIIKTNYGHTPAWEPTSYSKYLFDNNSRLVRAEHYIVYGGQTSSGQADSFTYTGAITQPIRHGSYQYNPPLSWQLTSFEDHHLNAQDLIDTIRAYTAGQVGYDTLELHALHYFNNTQIDDISVYKYTAGQYDPVPYKTQHRYYEEYFPTSIAQVAEKKNEVVVYPNPIRDQVSIRTNIQSGTVAIHNMLGQTVFSKEFTTLNGSSIDMTAYPAGQYILRISSDAGEPVHTQQLTKR